MPQRYSDRWEVIETIGEGGQAQVFKVSDAQNPGAVAVLKRLKNLKRVERFKRELEAVQKLDHPNVVRLLDFDLEAPKPFLVFAFAEAGTLATALVRTSAEPLLALSLFSDVCEGVAAAHDLGIVHRDLKPENLLLRGQLGPVAVGDFGICYIDDGQQLTMTEEAVGPRLYMAPEFEDGRADVVTAASDVYSLGKVLWALLAGKQVFARERHRDKAFDLTELAGVEMERKHAMEHVNRLLDQMIVSDPTKRLKNAGVVLAELRQTTRLVKFGYQAIATGLDLRCIFCGEGKYTRVATGTYGVRNFGFEQVGNPNWRIFTCSHCGHVQLFRIENAKHIGRWGNST